MRRSSTLTSLLLLSSTHATAAPAATSDDEVTYPSALQVDLVFPTNGTYSKPTENFFPFVFAMHNAKFSTALLPFIETRITKLKIEANGTETPFTSSNVGYGLGYPEVRNFSSDADPYYYTYPWAAVDTPGIDVEGPYELKWRFYANNCSETNLSDWKTSRDYSAWDSTVRFTIGDGGKDPNDAATLVEDSCRMANQSVVVQAVKQVKMETDAFWANKESPNREALLQCTVLDTQEKTPKPEACGSLSEEAAKKVLAEMKEKFEAPMPLPGGGTPSPSGAAQAGTSGIKVLVPTLCLVAMMVNLLG